MFSKHFLLLTNSLQTLKEVFLRECVSYFSCYEDRIHDRSNVRNQGYWGSQFRTYSFPQW